NVPRSTPRRGLAREIQVAILREPVDRVVHRFGRVAPRAAKLPRALAAREIHVLRGHSQADEADARLRAGDAGDGLRAERDRIDGPARQPDLRTRTPASIRDELEDLLEAHVASAEDVALERLTPLEREQMPACDVVDVHEVQPRVDKRGNAAERGIE